MSTLDREFSLLKTRLASRQLLDKTPAGWAIKNSTDAALRDPTISVTGSKRCLNEFILCVRTKGLR
jgi:hypothetical protein